MIQRDLEITNKRGLHARAAAKFVKLVGAYRACITVSRDGNDVSGDSIMGLMMLAAAAGSVITVRADGDDAVAAMTALSALVDGGFDEA